jgi:hypothetical protein
MVEGQETLFHWLLVAWLIGWLAHFVSLVTYSKPTGPIYVCTKLVTTYFHTCIPTYLPTVPTREVAMVKLNRNSVGVHPQLS